MARIRAFVGVGGGYRAATATAGNRAVKTDTPIEGDIHRWLSVESHERRFASHTFNTERHLFIDAAWQLIQYRKWVGRLGIVSNDAFQELDAFEQAVNTLRDHAIEYLKGGGDPPDRWICQAEERTSTRVRLS